jgi:hypothetical protein
MHRDASLREDRNGAALLSRVRARDIATFKINEFSLLALNGGRPTGSSKNGQNSCSMSDEACGLDDGRNQPPKYDKNRLQGDDAGSSNAGNKESVFDSRGAFRQSDNGTIHREIS